MGDTNDLKYLGFHSINPRRVRGRNTSPEEREQTCYRESKLVHHQAADESFVRGQELRWAEEGLCVTEDSQSVTGFGCQVGNVAFPGKIMADSETQKLERKDFIQRIVEKVDGGFSKRCFRRDKVRV